MKEVEREAEAQMKYWEERVRKQPNNTENARMLAQTALSIGDMYLWEFRLHEAEQWSGRATRLFTEYYEKFPNTPDTQKQLRSTHWIRSVALHWQGRSIEAIPEIDLSLKYTPDPDKPNPMMLRTRYVAKTGNHKAAEAKIMELLKTPPTGEMLRWFYWDAALGYAQCARAVQGDEKLSSMYGDKAINVLRKAVAEGVDYSVFPRMDPDLIPLRDRGDFREIVAELWTKFPSQRVRAPAPREVKR